MTRVRLELYATNLKNVAGAFKGISDPFAIVTLLANDPRGKPRILGKTEVIKNTLNPRWTTSFELDYEIGALCRVNIGIYDEIRKSSNKPMGSALFEVGEILGSRGNTKAKKLRNGGTLFCRVTAAGAGGSAAHVDGKLHLLLQGQQLKNLDGLFGKSDPFFEIHAKIESAGGLTWMPIFRSKHVDNNLNPKWEHCSLSLDRLCGSGTGDTGADFDRPILIRVWDWQKNGKHQSMGSVETSINGMVAAQMSKTPLTLKQKGKDYGKILVTTATVEGGTGGGGGSSAAATKQSAAQPAAAAAAAVQPVAAPPPESRVDDSHVPGFAQALDVPPPTFSTGATAAMAAMTLSSSAAASSSSTNRPVAAASPAASAPYVPAASTTPTAVSALPPPMMPPTAPMVPAAVAKPDFVDYLSGGCELELCIAIDFTGSNGDPRRPGTLHYIHPDGQQFNDYEKALTAVGSVVARYDSDQRFPVYGFGAKYGGVIQHCFQVGNAPTLDGLSGVLEGYRTVFRTGLTMSGPTVFSEVIGYAAAMARSSQESKQRIGQQSYKILLILTDGAVSNVEETKQALQNASDAPLSIVIVGIGNADFSAMQFLDDFQVMGAGGGRDICQFVEFNRYAHDKAALTKATLEEIPTQLVDYFHGRGIKPLPPISGSQISLAVSEADEEDIDLSIQYNEEGEISLANEAGAVYDDTKYGNMSTFAHPVPVHVPAGGSAPPPYRPGYHPPGGAPQPHQPYQPHQPQAFSAPANPYVPGAAAPPPPPPHHQPAQPYQQPHHHHPPSAAAPPPVMATAVSPPKVFHVQVPPNVSPGTQLQVQNPVTGQQMIVVIPPGVAPGGRFAVQY